MGLHGTHSFAWRRAGRQNAHSRLSRQTLGGRAHAFVDEPFPALADPLGEEGRELPGVGAFCVCFHRVQRLRAFRIGSNTTAALIWYNRAWILLLHLLLNSG